MQRNNTITNIYFISGTNNNIILMEGFKMVDFDKLNRETREHNNKDLNRFNTTTNSKYNYFNYLNNQTYKQNNGIYTKKYF